MAFNNYTEGHEYNTDNIVSLRTLIVLAYLIHRVFIVAIMRIKMPAATSPYSMVVAPFSSLMNARNLDMEVPRKQI